MQAFSISRRLREFQWAKEEFKDIQDSNYFEQNLYFNKPTRKC